MKEIKIDTYNAGGAGSDFIPPNKILIDNSQSKKQQLHDLFHEIMHCIQYWRERKFKYNSEKEANEFADKCVNFVRKLKSRGLKKNPRLKNKGL